MNSCLVNCFEGPDSSLPLHADDEMTIHPESCIHTLSLGSPCTIRFVENQGSNSAHDHLCATRSIYSMTRRSQEFYKHCINPGSVTSGTRYSITLRSVSHKNRNSTALIGDSNTGKLKFGTDKRKTFGQWLPGKQFFAPVISDINPYVSCGYQNIVILCGINDLKRDDVKNCADVRRIFDLYVEKVNSLQAANPKAHIYVCPPLPSKRAELNRKSIYFNKLICSELLPYNFGVTFVDGFDEFCDQTGLLSPLLSQSFDKYHRQDYLHLNWRGAARLGVIIRNTVLLRMNGGVDRRQRTGRVDERSYRDATAGHRSAPSTAGNRPSDGDGYQSA